MKKYIMSSVEVLIIVAIALIVLLIGLLPNKPATKLEAEAPQATIKNTSEGLTYKFDGWSDDSRNSPKRFFRLSDKRIINISMVSFNGVEWSYDSTQAITLTGAEKVRFEEWVDSWGVLTTGVSK